MYKALSMAAILVIASAFSGCKKKDDNTVAPSPYPAILLVKGGFEPAEATGMVKIVHKGFITQFKTPRENVDADGGKLQMVFIDMGPTAKNYVVPLNIYEFSHQDQLFGAGITTAVNGSFVGASTETNAGGTSVAVRTFSGGSPSFPSGSFFIQENFLLNRISRLSDGFLLCGARISGGSRDAFIIKVDNNLVLKWSRLYGGADNDMALEAVDLCDGNIGVLGYTYSFGAGDRDVLFLKYSPAGDLLDTKTYGGSGYEEPQRILTGGPDCKLFIAGHSASFGSPEHDAYMLCIDNNGNKIWENTYGTPNHDGFMCVTFFPANNALLAAGRTMQPNGTEDVFVQAIGLEGAPLWSRTYGDANLTENPADIITEDEFYYVLCNRYSATSQRSVVFVKDKL